MTIRVAEKKTPKRQAKKPKSGSKLPDKAAKNALAHRALPDLYAVLLATIDETLPVRVADSDGNIVFANQLYKTEIAAGKEVGITLDLIEIIHQVEVLQCPITQELKIEKSGRIAAYRAKHSLMQIGGKATRPVIISIYHDISVEDQVKSRLVLNQSRLDDITRLTSDWVWETDSELRLTMTSHRIFDLMGIHPREFIGRNIFMLGAGDPKAVHAETGIPHAVAQLRPFRDISFHIPDRKGKLHSFKFSGMPVFDTKSGDFNGYRGTASDITAELEARRQADMYEKRLSHAIENISEGFSLFDKDNKLILVNSRFKNFYPKTAPMLQPGMDKLEWLRASVLAHDVDIGDLSADEWIKQRLVAWHRHESALEIKLGDGRYLMVRDYKTDDGGTVSIRADITRIKERELALIDARQQADGANRAKGEFFAKMSHELRTPLNAIIGFSDIMKSSPKELLDSNQIKTYSQDINDSASHLLNIINDILDVSKAEAGKLELVEQNVSVISAVQSTVRMLSDHAERSGVLLDTKQIDPNLVIRADQKKLRQILINLFSNAIKFTLSGGKISAATEIDKDGNLVLSVADTGIGMRAEDIPKALTPFAQVDNDITRHHEGTGLGLPLCVALAELHGGSLRVESEIDKGTTIFVTLPASRLVKHPAIKLAAASAAE